MHVAARPPAAAVRASRLLARSLLAGLWLAALATAPPVRAQPASPTSQQLLIEVRRQQVELRAAQAERDRIEQLFRQGLVSEVELTKANTEVERAQLRYQDALLTLINQRPKVTIREAVKYGTEDGRKFVRLGLANLTASLDDSQFRALSNFEGAEPLPAELTQRDLRGVTVSLAHSGSGDDDEAGTIIALPYERQVELLRYGQAVTLTFQLLRDVSNVAVLISHQGLQREVRVQLQQDTSDTSVAIASTQLSQEVDLGGQADYGLELSRSTVDVRSYHLKVLNLPTQVGYSFIDPDSEARLSQLNFPAGVTRTELDLRLFLPERAEAGLSVDEPLSFVVVAAEPAAAAGFAAERVYDASEVDASGAGHLELTAIPRGRGRLEVSAASLFSEVRPGQAIETELTVRNDGSRRVDNMTTRLETPQGWRAAAEPAGLAKLEMGEETRVRVRITPPPDVGVGDYEVRIRTEAFSANRPLPVENKVYRVSVAPGGGSWVTALLFIAFLLLIGIIVVGGVKLARR